MTDIEWPKELRPALMWLKENIGAERLKKASAFIRNVDDNRCWDAAPDAVEYIRADLALALVAEACEGMVNQAVDMADGRDEAAYIEDRMRDAIPADAIAAREARDEQVREEALREGRGVKVKPLDENDRADPRVRQVVAALEDITRRAEFAKTYQEDKFNFGWMIRNARAALAAIAETEGEWAWVKGVVTTTDDDGGRRKGVRRKLHVWRANGFTIIQQDSPDGLFILRHPSGDGSAWPSLEQAKQAALAETEGDSDDG